MSAAEQATPTVKIEEKGCRGCTLCVDICPADVFDFDEQTELAKVPREADCIGCYSCFYLCPSQCIAIDNTHIQRPFYRIEGNVALVERFLQEPAATKTLAVEDWEEAYKDVSSTTSALGMAIIEMMGRATKALGRQSGAAAAAYMPEMYEEKDLEGVMASLQKKLQHAFDFDYKVDGNNVDFDFKPCGLVRVVQDAGEKVGEAPLCEIFHDYMAGLLRAYTGCTYKYELPRVGANCLLKLRET